MGFGGFTAFGWELRLIPPTVIAPKYGVIYSRALIPGKIPCGIHFWVGDCPISSLHPTPYVKLFVFGSGFKVLCGLGLGVGSLVISNRADTLKP